jgi:peptide chain release factor 1
MLLDKLKPFVEKYNEINQMLSSPEITQDIKKNDKTIQRSQKS